MNSEQRYWLRIWALAAAVTTVLILCTVIIAYNKQLSMENMILHGVDPIELNCLMYADSKDPTCAALALKVVPTTNK